MFVKQCWSSTFHTPQCRCRDSIDRIIMPQLEKFIVVVGLDVVPYIRATGGILPYVLRIHSKAEEVHVICDKTSSSPPTSAFSCSLINPCQHRDRAHYPRPVIAHRKRWDHRFIDSHSHTLSPSNSRRAVCNLLPSRSICPGSTVAKAIFVDIDDSLSTFFADGGGVLGPKPKRGKGPRTIPPQTTS